MKHILVLCVVVLLVGTTNALPSWQCRVCEDVAQTWHDHFPCAGNFLDWGHPLSPDIHACQFPEFDCNKLDGQVKAACFDMIKQFTTQQLLQRILWETMMLHDQPYRTCIALGKCEQEDKLKGPTACHQAFLDPYCKHNWLCKNYTAQCSETCYLCNWLVRDWPLFQETCKPQGASLPQSVPRITDVYPKDISKFFPKFGGKGKKKGKKRSSRALFLAMEEELRARHALRTNRARDVLLEEREAATDEDGVEAEHDRIALDRRGKRGKRRRKRKKGGSKRTSSAPKTRLITGFTLTEECYNQWQMFRKSAKARFFGSWKRYVSIMTNPLDRLKGKMWDANVACKCLGKCSLNRYEDLGLVEACRYEEEEENFMKYVWSNSQDVSVTQH